MTAQAMHEEFRRGGVFQSALLRYTQALITQISQTAVCNCVHPIEKRLCRWLLMTRNRLPSNEVHMTQEFLAYMLGVRREGVTLAARRLQAGLIRYRRGHVTILDRAGLEAATCECIRWSKTDSIGCLVSARLDERLKPPALGVSPTLVGDGPPAC
jgi:hypothetical protein